MNTIEILEGAKAQIEESGWGRTVLYDYETGCMCALGGMAAAVIGKDELINQIDENGGYVIFDKLVGNKDLVQATNDVLDTMFENGIYDSRSQALADYSFIYSYNDTTTKEKVIELFDATIDRLKGN